MAAPNQPTFNSPDSGQLTNKRGSNLAADSIAFANHYANPLSGSSDGIGNIRVTASRVARFGNQLQTAETVWDTNWTGAPSVQSIPTAASEGEPVCGYGNGRVYVLFLGKDAAGGSGNCWSAPLLAGGVGQWRPETGLGSPGQWFGTWSQTSYSAGATQLVVIPQARYASAWIYACISTPTASQIAIMVGAPLSSDGKVGAWQNLGPLPYGIHGQAFFAGGLGSSESNVVFSTSGAYLVIAGGLNYLGTVNQQVAYAGVWTSGQMQNQPGVYPADPWYGVANLPANRKNGVAYYDSNAPSVYIIGGDDGTNAQSTVYSIIFPSNGYLQSASWNTINALVAPRTDCALAAYLASNATVLLLMGGSATIGGAASTAVYYTYISGPGATAGGWGTSSIVLPASGAGIVGFTGSTPGMLHTGQRGDQGAASGATAAQVFAGYMYTGSACRMVNTNTGTWYTGNASGLTVANLGTTGASIASKADGSQDIGWLWNAWGGVAASALSDGDQVQVAVQYVSIQGFPSAVGTMIFRVGQAPAISSIVPANGATPNNGRPAISFVYTPGAGGQGEQWWQVQVKQGSTVIYDTGQVFDQVNAIASMKIGPLLLPSTVYTLVITVNALDVPMSGSTDQTVSTTTFTTTAFAAPAAPGSVTATPGAGLVALSWGTVAGCTYRIYHRRNGASAWRMIADALASTTYNAMDEEPLGIGMDYAISAVNATPAESALSTVQSNKVISDPDRGGWLHIAGQGATYGMEIPTPIDLSATESLDAAILFGFGQGAPIARFGATDYRKVPVTLRPTDTTPATLVQLQAILDQLKAGQIGVLRDVRGNMLTVSLDGDQGMAFFGGGKYRTFALKFVEVANLLGPYVTAGSAQGVPTLVNGRKPPLSTAERIL